MQMMHLLHDRLITDGHLRAQVSSTAGPRAHSTKSLPSANVGL